MITEERSVCIFIITGEDYVIPAVCVLLLYTKYSTVLTFSVHAFVVGENRNNSYTHLDCHDYTCTIKFTIHAYCILFFLS